MCLKLEFKNLKGQCISLNKTSSFPSNYFANLWQKGFKKLTEIKMKVKWKAKLVQFQDWTWPESPQLKSSSCVSKKMYPGDTEHWTNLFTRVSSLHLIHSIKQQRLNKIDATILFSGNNTKYDLMKEKWIFHNIIILYFSPMYKWYMLA